MIMNRTYPYLLILKSKHDPYYFHIDNHETFGNALKKIFEINDDNEYYYFEGFEDPSKLEGDVLKRIENIEKLQEVQKNSEIIIDGLDRQIRSLQQELLDLKRSYQDKLLYDKAKSGDIPSIFKFVWDRRSHQYEEIGIEDYS